MELIQQWLISHAPTTVGAGSPRPVSPPGLPHPRDP